ncbi:hypothetical protein ACJMK2_035011 [Sinanodonta woodiana]|uniref:Uncharacterized protein n=1 Tax=Sinanodonta woodiana TaxID=1069815 RepID=A0ABD3WTI9_SINWO
MKAGKSISPSFHRINYLYQAAFLCMKTTPENLGLCRFYIETIKTIAKKEVLKLHPYMKRNFCKRCCVLLIPGVSAKLRTRSKRQKHTVITCLECGNIRRYPNIPREKKWFDQMDEDADDKTVQHQMAHGNAKQSIGDGDKSVSQQNTLTT